MATFIGYTPPPHPTHTHRPTMKTVWLGPPTGDENLSFPVTSFSQRRPDHVVMDDITGKVECECANWKSVNMSECFSSC